jgi:hypothetical protein
MSKSYSIGPTISVDLIQQYSIEMQDVIKSNFFTLAKVPNYLYFMLSTMEQESSFRILHGSPPTANHTEVVKPQTSASGKASNLGKAYWYDPVIAPLKFSDSIKDPLNALLVEGLTAKALMGTMGLYQVRNTAEHNRMCNGSYRSIAQNNGLIVNPGASSSVVFTNDITGARRSMIMGCIIMENHLIAAYRRGFVDPQDALLWAAGTYVGVDNWLTIVRT